MTIQSDNNISSILHTTSQRSFLDPLIRIKQKVNRDFNFTNRKSQKRGVQKATINVVALKNTNIKSWKSIFINYFSLHRYREIKYQEHRVDALALGSDEGRG